MSTIHVVPIADLVDHHVPGGTEDVLAKYGNPDHGWLMVESLAEGDADMACVCGPAAECVPNPEGPDGWLISHRSLDGREVAERVGG